MDGYVTLNSQQFETALTRAIAVLGEKVAQDEAEREAKIAEIWEGRTWYFGPWNRSGAQARYYDWLGYGTVEVSARKQLLRDYQTQLLRIDVMNAEPYLIKLKDFNKLMEWAK